MNEITLTHLQLCELWNLSDLVSYRQNKEGKLSLIRCLWELDQIASLKCLVLFMLPCWHSKKCVCPSFGLPAWYWSSNTFGPELGTLHFSHWNSHLWKVSAGIVQAARRPVVPSPAGGLQEAIRTCHGWIWAQRICLQTPMSPLFLCYCWHPTPAKTCSLITEWGSVFLEDKMKSHQWTCFARVILYRIVFSGPSLLCPSYYDDPCNL
jgi:hypothetical protein